MWGFAELDLEEGIHAEGCDGLQIQRTEDLKVKKEVKFNKPKRDNGVLSWKDAKPGTSDADLLQR